MTDHPDSAEPTTEDEQAETGVNDVAADPDVEYADDQAPELDR